MQALRTIYTIWLREFLVFWREKSRIVGMFAQPLMYLLIVGNGIAAGMSLKGGGIDYLKFMYPGIIGMSMLFTAIFSAMSIIWDREFGFLKEVLVAPVPRWSVAVGKMCGGATISVFQAIILIALAPFIGIHLTLFVVIQIVLFSALLSLGICGLGVMIAAKMTSMQGFQMVMNFLVMPLYFLSGAMFPISSSPRALRVFMLVDPVTYGVDGIRGAIFSATTTSLNGVQVNLGEAARHAGLVRWSLGQDLAILSAVTLAFMALGAYRFSRAK